MAAIKREWLIVKYANRLFCVTGLYVTQDETCNHWRVTFLPIWVAVKYFTSPFLSLPNILIQWIGSWPLSTWTLSFSFLSSSLAALCFLFFSRVLRHSDPLRVPSSRFLFLHHFFSWFFFFSFSWQSSHHPLRPPHLRSLSMRDQRSFLVCETERIGIFAMSHYQGDPWHLGVPLLCMQGMSARCSPALMKRITHSHADSAA